MMEKLDLTKQYKSYYAAKRSPELVTLESARFLTISGKGAPSGRVFSKNLQALYATAYGIKFMFKALNRDFVVPKLQGQWSFDESIYQNLSIDTAPTVVPRSEWHYRMLIRMPGFVDKEHVAEVVETTTTKKQILLARDIEFYEFEEGKAVQMLHLGPFSTEPDTLKQMQEFMEKNNLKRNGLHHEIYLSDFNKTAPENLRTILREPVI